MNDLKALARRAIVYALPVYEMARMRSASTLRKTPQGQLADAEIRRVHATDGEGVLGRAR